MGVIIGLGNAGTQIVRLAAESRHLADEQFFSIDSVASSVTMKDVSSITSIPIISDSKSGSGRNRERGRAMFDFHCKKNEFDAMVKACKDSKEFVIAVSSSSGGTGSGAIVGLCDLLIKNGIMVIPIIICPSEDDPSAYHLNTNDLFVELGDVGIGPYCIFKNPHTSDYSNINKAVVRAIEVIRRVYYDETEGDSIDVMDLQNLFEMPGRFIAAYAEAKDVTTLKKEITRAVLSGYQPGWSTDSANEHTYMAAFSLSSVFAKSDYDDVFSEIEPRLGSQFDVFKNIAPIEGDICYASAIITGLPTVKTKDVADDFNLAGGISDGMKRSKRPSFMSKKKATIVQDEDGVDSFNWS